MNPVIESAESFQARLDAAWLAVEGGVSMQGSPDFPQKVNQRLETVEAVAEMRSSMIDRRVLAQVNRLLAQSRSAGSRVKRVLWLRKAADTFSDAVSPHAACQKGCAHCCHIPVSLSEGEAASIGKAIGVAPAAGAPARPRREVDGDPCPFLADGTCSIYDNRPIICRSHFNMDADDLLCQLVPGAAVPVPYMDNRAIMLGVMLATGVQSAIADVRDWFPGGRGRT